MGDFSKKLLGIFLGISLSLGVGASLSNSVHHEAVGVKAVNTTVIWTAYSGALGSAINTVGITATGTIKTGDYIWDYTRTFISVKENKSDHVGMNHNYIQLGSSNALEKLQLTTSKIPGTIKNISLDCASGSGTHTLKISVNDEQYYSSKAPSWDTKTYGSIVSTTGTSSGKISILFESTSTSSYVPIYLKSISVTYELETKPESIAVSDNSGKTWYDGDTITTTDLKVIPTYATGDGDPITDGTDVFFDEGKTLTEKVLSKGENILTVWYNGTSGSLTITALAPRVLQSISVSGYKDSFSQGDDFEFGGTVTATYNVGDNVDVTSESTFTGYDLSNVGTQTVTVTYEDKTTTYEITVTKSMNVIFDATSDYPGENESTTEFTKNNVTIEILKGEAASYGTLANQANYRIYKSNYLTISVGNESELKITKIDLICDVNSGGEYGPENMTLSSKEGTYSYSGVNGIWSKTDGSRQVILLAKDAQVRITKLTVTLMDYTFETEAKEYAVYFNEFIGCDSTGAVEPDGWSDLKEMWSDLSSGAQNVLKNVDTSTETDADILKCITTYEYIVNKYNSKDPTTYNDFMVRGIVSANASNAIYRTTDNNTAILIVVLVAFTSITAIGGYFFIRRRKYN